MVSNRKIDRSPVFARRESPFFNCLSLMTTKTQPKPERTPGLSARDSYQGVRINFVFMSIASWGNRWTFRASPLFAAAHDLAVLRFLDLALRQQLLHEADAELDLLEVEDAPLHLLPEVMGLRLEPLKVEVVLGKNLALPRESVEGVDEHIFEANLKWRTRSVSRFKSKKILSTLL